MHLSQPRRAARIATISAISLLAGAALLAPATTTANADSAKADQKATTSTTTSTTQSTAQSSSAKAGSSRPFRSTSYWNKPLGRAPRDSSNRQFIADAYKGGRAYMNLVLGDWGMPVYHSGAGDPLYRIKSGPGWVRVHIPNGARHMPTSDAAMVVIDKATHQVIGLGGARFSKKAGWSASGVSRYLSRSNGIAGGLPGGLKANYGHRGIPGSVQAVTRDEIRRGVIRHRLEVYWHETKSGRAYFPMTQSESGKNGVVPEGMVIRIKPSVNLKALKLSRGAYIIARALQRYGAVVGDNSGQGNSIKIQGNAKWGGVLNKDSLRKIKWNDYVFVKRGYRP